jgi:hypothetical protein
MRAKVKKKEIKKFGQSQEIAIYIRIAINKIFPLDLIRHNRKNRSRNASLRIFRTEINMHD